ncbi:hypothetical protein [Curtobacterium poinsettiae]|uniref:hypothetical protein n=1 Tax=Curtobacterium poinsettiae TaxID=159612 RepID=UPI0021C56E43|nr:hypothetical protein [Curtobacterium flaccumfaciens]MCU0116179.1 hypothetical protein [Curtobacterium flaccumfaciens]
MRQNPEDSNRRRRRQMATLLGVIAGVLWVVAVALPILVLVLIGNLHGEDPARTQRSFLIAFSVFMSFALLALPTTIGFVVVRHAQVNNYDT